MNMRLVCVYYVKTHELSEICAVLIMYELERDQFWKYINYNMFAIALALRQKI